jgi:uncharacterized protein (DUF1499 family)
LASSASLLAFALLPPQIANADEEPIEQQTPAVTATATAPTSTRQIQGCPKIAKSGKPSNCIGTSNIKQLDSYSPPWTFDVSPDEAFARLKGIVTSDPSFTIVEIDADARFLAVDVKRLNTVDSMEFLVKGDDQVVIFKSFEKDLDNVIVSDFGANRKRVEELRKKSGGVFSVMGAGLTADSYDGGAAGKRNGVGGQLKAFYGLNSGQGYEGVFE